MKKFIVAFFIPLLVVLVSGSSFLYNKTTEVPKDFQTKLFEARKFVLLFEYDKANLLYKEAIKQQESVSLLEEYLAFLVTQDNFEESYKIAASILKEDPNQALANVVNSAYLIKKNMISKALESIKPAAKDISSFSSSFYINMYNIDAFTRNNTGQFNFVSSQIKEQLPSFYYNQIALYYILTKNYDKANETLSFAVKNYPSVDNIILYSKLLYIKDKQKGIDNFKEYLGQPLLTDNAIDHYINNYYINNVDVTYIMSDALYRLSTALNKESEKKYIQPSNILISHVAFMLNDENLLADLQLISRYIKIGNYTKALYYFNKIPKNSFYYHLLFQDISKIYLELGKTSEAINILNVANTENPSNPTALLEIGHLLYKENKVTNAIKYYSIALDVSTRNKQKLGEWLALYFRGIAYNKNNQLDKSTKDLLAALKINNKDQILLNYLGYLWIDKEINVDAGLDLVKRALMKEPNNPNFLDSYAWGLFKKGKYKEALRISLEVKKDLPVDSSINNHIGDIYFKLNNKAEAILYWKTALNSSEDIQSRNEFQNKLNGILPKYLQ